MGATNWKHWAVLGGVIVLGVITLRFFSHRPDVAAPVEPTVPQNRPVAAVPAVPKVPPTVSSELRVEVARLRALRRCHPEEIDQAIAFAGIKGFEDLTGMNVTREQLEEIVTATQDLQPCNPAP